MTNAPNNSADWDWSVYFENENDPAVRTTLKHALVDLGRGDGRLAIDLGCGHGNDTVHILQAGFQVLAIDQSRLGLDHLVSRETMVNTWNLKTLESGFESIELPKCDFLNASFALPFCTGDVFLEIWQKIETSISDGGVFAGHLFGINDSWNGRVVDMNFHDRDSVLKLMSGYDVVHFAELENDGTDAVGRPKHWHQFEIVIKSQ